MPQINFNVTRKQMDQIVKLIELGERKDWLPFDDRTSNLMDLCAAMNNGNPPLDLDRMVSVIGTEHELDLAHDLGGIRAHIDRSTGVIGDCFLPRFTVKG